MLKRPRHEIPEDRSINMTPMIDVVFQLILFFMLTSSLSRPNQIELDLPESSSGVKAQEQQTLVVTYRLDQGNPEVKLNGESLKDLDALGAEMRKHAAPEQQARVDVQIDRTVPYQNFIAVIDSVRDAGFPRFSLQTLAPRTATQ